MTAKKRLSRVLAFALVLALMTALAVPGLAANRWAIPYSEGQSSGYCLNVYGNDTIALGRNVCLWQADIGKAQQWTLGANLFGIRNDGYMRMHSEIDRSYALNVYKAKDANGNYNCTVYTINNNPALDTAITTISPAGSVVFCWAGNTDYELRAGNLANNANVVWSTNIFLGYGAFTAY